MLNAYNALGMRKIVFTFLSNGKTANKWGKSDLFVRLETCPGVDSLLPESEVVLRHVIGQIFND